MTIWQNLKSKFQSETFPYVYDIYFSLYSENKRYSKIKILLGLIKSTLFNITFFKKNISLMNNEVLFIDTRHYPVFSNFIYFDERYSNRFYKITLEKMEVEREIKLQEQFIKFTEYFLTIKQSRKIYYKISLLLNTKSYLDKVIIFLIIYKNLILLKKFNTIKGLQKIYFGHNSSTLISLIYNTRKDIKTITIQHGLPVETYFPIQSDYYLVWDEYSKNKFIKNGVDEEKLYIESCPRFDIYKDFKKTNSNNIRITYFTQISSPEVSTEIQLKTLLEFSKIIKNRNDVKLFIRPHPADNIDLIIKTLSKVVDFKIVTKDLVKVFANTDIAVSLYSTVLYEAKFLGIKTVQISLKNENYSCFDFVDTIVSNLKNLSIERII